GEIASDAIDYLFPSSELRARGGVAAVTSTRSAMASFDPECGDALHLEDESGRIVLEPMTNDNGSSTWSDRALDPNAIVTGVVVAVIGRVDGDRGVMRVRSVHFAGPPPPPPPSAATSSTIRGASDASLLLRGPTPARGDDDGMTDVDDVVDHGGPILLLVSGLGCGCDSPTDVASGGSLAVRREMLLEYLTNPKLSDGASVCRVIVAGGGVFPPPPSTVSIATDDGGAVKSGMSDQGNVNGKRRRDYNVAAASESSSRDTRNNDAAAHVSRSLFDLDVYLSELLGSGIPVDYVPGWHDPTNANWPQRPLHSCLLPRSTGYIDLFCRGTNPYECVLGGGGDDGGGGSEGGLRGGGDATTTDADSGVVAPSSCIDALHRTLMYGHMAPTGPDSLPTFPSCEYDPFVLTSRPNVYFAGNCDVYETRLVNCRGEEIVEENPASTTAHDMVGGATRLVCVPSFALTGEVVLVKLRTLECEVLSFNDVPNL
ncbi:hypothetical protein ACHAXA_009128, partial [Cyclostephanos tholiformis]